MDSPDHAVDAPPSIPPPGGLQDLVLNLNFVPSWAKGTAGANPYAGHEGESRSERPSGERREFRRDGRDGRRSGPGGGGGGDRRGPRRDQDRGPRRDGGGPRGDRGPRREGGRDERRGGPRGAPDRRGPRSERDFAPRLPVQVTFVPERTHLGVIVKEIHEKRRAYPLAMVAGLFLQKPENHQIKFEVQSNRPEAANFRLWQNAKTGMVFLSKETAQGFAVARDLEEFFEKQDQPIDPPVGNFVCVGRCSLSGELLGPPNYHGYQERLHELHRSRFAHMPLDVYRGRIEVVRDPAVVEQWKEQARTIRRYRDKTEPEGPATLKRSEAEFRFMEKYAKDLFKQGNRFLMPGQRAADLPDPELRRLVRDAWTRESRFPMTLLFALRAAFKHMKLQLFKVGNETFATPIQPKPIDAVHVVENIQKIIDLLREHPGWTRKELVEHLHPGVAPDGPEAAEALQPLRWLIDKGHVIEFFNGTLSLPAAPAQKPAPAVPEQKSAEVAATEAVAEPPAPESAVAEAAPAEAPAPAIEPAAPDTPPQA